MKRTIIIAEAGVNHNGDINLAKRLIDEAEKAGADYVKFQTAKLDSLVSKNANMAEYQKCSVGKVESQKDMLRRLLLTFDEFKKLHIYCQDKNVKFLSTPFDVDSIYFLNDLVPFWKIPSGEITNYPYLVEIGKTGKSVVMSTGMSTIDEIKEAVAVLKKYGTKEISLLHCNTQYPTPYDDVNLFAMNTLKNTFECPVGYSDHTKGIEISIAAVSMGAEIIEKHFTLDRNMEGPDHKASLEPDELKAMISAIRNVEKALGTGEKMVSDSERENISIARKSIVASRKIQAGEVFSEDNITTKRPGNGISPMRWNEVIGKVAIKDFDEDELISL